MMGILFAVAALGVLTFALSLVRHTRWYQHRQLFWQLCRQHQLDRSSRRLLLQLSRQLRLPFPAWVFVDPRCLAAAQQMPTIPPAQLLQVQAKLFGETPEQAAPPASQENPQNPNASAG
ncbi:MAG TPA: hypothetical protein PK777_10145 [Thermoguttaceae bacterium]|nr:hypothetical protein [Thermoguttaceae bacterium]HPP53300.1 hypothetical protein [Thermoguttaceae bacterium]